MSGDKAEPVAVGYYNEFPNFMKPVPNADFRSRRLILEPEDFALGPDAPDGPPTDLIDIAVWRSMTSLQDDVSIRTTDHFGCELKDLWECWTEWSCLTGVLQSLSGNPQESPICHVASDVGDEFQSSICNALVGFYRVAFSCLRNALEHMSIGAQLELSPDTTLFQAWLNGDRELGLGWAADLLRNNRRVVPIEQHCQLHAGDDFFRQKTPGGDSGGVRRLFKKLSKFTHGSPGFTDADIRNSNGPIFVPGTFRDWAACFRLTFSIAVFEAKLAEHNLTLLAFGSSLTAQGLFQRAISQLPNNEDVVKLLTAVPVTFW
jgi:hypothetical protein